MERFWDARAREDAFWFVDSRLEYRSPDEAAFWAGGEEALERLLGGLGAQIGPGDTVVDLGCGIGRLTRPLAARADRVLALDVSGEMLAEARRRNAHLDGVEWLQGDGISLAPVGDASVDAVISHVVLRHIPDPSISLGYIAEMGRVLRPGGIAAIEFSNHPGTHRRRAKGVGERLAAAAGRAPRGVTDDAWLGSWLELTAVRATATEAGMDVEQVVGEGTQYCAVLLRRTDRPAVAPTTPATYYDSYWAADPGKRYDPAPELRALILDGVTGATRCLDVGCGTGNSYAPELARRAGAYTGVDVSAHAVEAAQAAGLDARVIDDAAELPFEDASFDHVTCIEVFEHLFAPHAAAAEIRRVLRPGGGLVVSVPNAAYWRLRANLLLGTWNPMGDEQSLAKPWRDPHLRFFTVATLERMLREAGFTDVRAGAHGGRGLDHLTSRPTAFGQGRLYKAAERVRPSLLGLNLHAVAVR
jgi:ubiquinone/menaquinone biosynthesis C-methylase UbiE